MMKLNDCKFRISYVLLEMFFGVSVQQLKMKVDGGLNVHDDHDDVPTIHSRRF